MVIKKFKKNPDDTGGYKKCTHCGKYRVAYDEWLGRYECKRRLCGASQLSGHNNYSNRSVSLIVVGDEINGI